MDDLETLLYTPETHELDVISPHLVVEDRLKSAAKKATSVVPSTVLALYKPTRTLGSTLLKDQATGAASNALELTPAQSFALNLVDGSIYKQFGKGLGAIATKAAAYAPKVGKALNTLADIAKTDNLYLSLLYATPEAWNWYNNMVYGDTVAAQRNYVDGIFDLPGVVINNTLMKQQEERDAQQFGNLGQANRAFTEIEATNNIYKNLTNYALDHGINYHMDHNGLLVVDETNEPLHMAVSRMQMEEQHNDKY